MIKHNNYELSPEKRKINYYEENPKILKKERKRQTLDNLKKREQDIHHYMNIMSKVKNVKGKVGEGVKFERIRRITGYLVGTLDRFNNGKRAEVEDRVKHGLSHN